MAQIAVQQNNSVIAAADVACEEIDVTYGTSILARHQNNALCDISLLGDGSSGLAPIKAHKTILAFASPHLHDAFQVQGFVDSNATEYDIAEIGHATLKVIVDFIYTSKLRLTGSNMAEQVKFVLKGADYLLMPELVRVCAQVLSRPAYLTAETCMDLWVFGRMFHSDLLADAAARKIGENLRTIGDNRTFVNLSKDDLIALIKTLANCTDGKAQGICTVACLWVCYKLSERKASSDAIMEHVPFHEMSTLGLQRARDSENWNKRAFSDNVLLKMSQMQLLRARLETSHGSDVDSLLHSLEVMRDVADEMMPVVYETAGNRTRRTRALADADSLVTRIRAKRARTN